MARRRGRSGADERVAELPGDPEQELGDPEAVARAICLRLLTQRARSRAELAAALAKRDVPDDAAKLVLDRFVEVGLIDDAALAASVAGAQHHERGLARRAVAAKLRERGLADQMDDALSGIDRDSERERARELVTKRRRALAGLPSDVQARRLVGLLARKGYPAGLAYGVVREALEADQPGWEPAAVLDP
ncbi:MAG TPA: regulatory protein RecX [Jatrophihabitans sp.]|nr:regulatory protein RecX [Jatrophihabitans sp.]